MIREETPVQNWHHVPTDQNPADILSRGAKAINLVNNDLWWHGPKFLKTENWPHDPVPHRPHVHLPEETALSRMVGIFTLLDGDKQAKLPTLFLVSNFRRGCRIMSWVNLFITKTRKSPTISSQRSERSGLECWIIMEQRYYFAGLIAQIKATATVSDKEFQSLYLTLLGGVLVVSGRLRRSGVPLLHKDSLLAKLWLEHLHANVLRHAGGPATLKAESHSLFWVWKGTPLFKRITADCTHCTKLGHTSTPQQMAPLPDFRFTATRKTAFETCGVDFAGPWWTDQGRGPGGTELPRKPRYLLVFACLTFRAIHLEMTYGHATQDVLEALQRFSSRRAIPLRIISDNAKELKKAAEVLAQCVKQPVSAFPLDPGWGETTWTFSHPRAPHTNGATESMVGVSKRAIKHVMPKHNLTDSLLQTVFTYCEDIVNRRPLVRNFTGDIHDPEILTPGHFLGQARGPLPPVQTQGTKNRFTLKWIEVADLRDKFYVRFQRELAPELEKKAKWWDIRPAPEPGDVVCVLEHKLTDYGHWPLGKIIETYTGRDGEIRSALLKLGDGTVLRRNLRHLIPLTDPRTHELASRVEENLK